MNPDLLSERERAIEQKAGRTTVLFLVLIAVWLIMGPLIPELSGFGWMEGKLGGKGGVACFFLGFLFLYFAGVVKDKERLRTTLDGFMKIIKRQVRGGPVGDPEQDRMAVDILLRALSSEKEEVRASAHKSLVHLTGLDHGNDAAAWQAWWKDARATFERAGTSPGEV